MTYSLNLRKFLAPEIIFGVAALELAGQYGRNLGGTKALVVSDPGVVRAGWVQQVLASIEGAGLGCTLFTSVSRNPRIEEIAAPPAAYAEQPSHIIPAVRGASVLASANATRLLPAN